MNMMNIVTTGHRTVVAALLVVIGFAACGEYEVISAAGEAVEMASPDLQFGKADKSSNTRLGDPLEAGTAVSGTVTGFAALPVTLSKDEVLEVQTWTERPAVIMVYGPRQGADWDLQRVRAATRDIKPGVNSEYLQYAAPATGDYLLVVGNGDDQPNRWILARAGHTDMR